MTTPLVPQPCDTCRRGCSCDPKADESCSHYGCHGRDGDTPSTCPGAVIEIGRYQALHAAEQARSRIFRARRAANSHAYALNLARQADAARAEVEATIAEQGRHAEP